MGNTLKAFLYGIASSVDFTGELGRKNIERIYNKGVINGFKVDKINLSKDFEKSIKSLVK